MYRFLFHWLVEDPQVPVLIPDSLQKARFAEVVRRVTDLDMQDLMINLLQQGAWILLKIVLALVLYFVGRWFIRRIVRLLDYAFARRRADLAVRLFIRNTIRAILMIILLLVVVQILGVNITSLIAIFSAATLAIGMAMSGTAQNFAGGLMILLMKPYRVGDYISAQDQSGTVREIKLFSTVIMTVDNRTIYIPNNTIATAIVDNYTAAQHRRVDWQISLTYGDDVDLAREVILGLLRADDRILPDPEPLVWLYEMKESCIVISARAWVKSADYWTVYWTFNEKFYKVLPEKGLRFPYPQLDVHLYDNQTSKPDSDASKTL